MEIPKVNVKNHFLGLIFLNILFIKLLIYFSYEEKLDLAKKQKIIKHTNTRLSKTPWKTDKQVESQING